MRSQCFASVHAVLYRDSEILMLRRYNTGYQDGMWTLPAGSLGGLEPVRDAACRETWEEVGLVIDPVEFRVDHVMHRWEPTKGEEWIDFFLTAPSWTGRREARNAEPDKHDAVQWWPLNSLPVNTSPFVRDALTAMWDEQVFSQYGWPA